MSAPRYYESFDVETKEVAERVLTGQPVTLIFDHQDTAKQAKMRFKALIKPWSLSNHQLANVARQLRVSNVIPREDGRFEVVVSHVSHCKVAQAIRASFDEFNASQAAGGMVPAPVPVQTTQGEPQ